MKKIEIIEKLDNGYTLLRNLNEVSMPIIYAFGFHEETTSWEHGHYFHNIEEYVQWRIKTSRYADVCVDLANYLEGEDLLEEALDNFSYYFTDENGEDIVPQTSDMLLYAINDNILEN